MMGEMRTSSLYWVNESGEEGTHHRTIRSHEVVANYGVPRGIVFKYLEKEITQAASLGSIAFTTLLVFAYAWVVISHDNAPAVNAVEDSIGLDLLEGAKFAYVEEMGFKGINEVNSHVDFWSWMSKGLLPRVFLQAPPYSSPDLDTRETYGNTSVTRVFYTNYNRIVGGIRMSQVRQDGDLSCTTEPELEVAYGMPCAGGQRYELDPEMQDARRTGDTLRQRTEFLYIQDDIQTVQRKVLKMELSGWLDNRTMKVEIAVPVYNAEYGIHALIHVHFYLSRGGHIWKAVIPMSDFANWHDDWLKAFSELLWCACLLWMIVNQALEIYRMLKAKGVFKFVADYSNPFTLVEWFSVFIGGGLIVMFSFMLKFTAELNDAAIVLGELSYVTQPSQYRAVFQNMYFPKLEEAVHYSHKFRLTMAGYPLVMMYRVFSAYAGQPRLHVVTQTLSDAAVDLLHFLLIFLSVVAVFSVSAVLLFGRRLNEFVTIWRTMQSTLLAIKGNFDWDELRVVGRIEAGVWFVSIIGIGSLLLLNMLLAIVMDSYSKVKSRASDSVPLWAALREAWRRSAKERRGHLVPLKRILVEIRGEVRLLMRERLEDDDKEATRIEEPLAFLTVGLMERIVPGLDMAQTETGKRQAETILEAACEEYYRQMANKRAPTLSFTILEEKLLDLVLDLRVLEETCGVVEPLDVPSVKETKRCTNRMCKAPVCKARLVKSVESSQRIEQEKATICLFKAYDDLDTGSAFSRNAQILGESAYENVDWKTWADASVLSCSDVAYDMITKVTRAMRNYRHTAFDDAKWRGVDAYSRRASDASNEASADAADATAAAVASRQLSAVLAPAVHAPSSAGGSAAEHASALAVPAAAAAVAMPGLAPQRRPRRGALSSEPEAAARESAIERLGCEVDRVRARAAADLIKKSMLEQQVSEVVDARARLERTFQRLRERERQLEAESRNLLMVLPSVGHAARSAGGAGDAGQQFASYRGP